MILRLVTFSPGEEYSSVRALTNTSIKKSISNTNSKYLFQACPAAGSLKEIE
jgi:hypothetical protein